MMVEKAEQRMRNVDKKSAEMAAKVEQVRKALATAEQNRDANEKALGPAEEPLSQDAARAFCSFPFWLPLWITMSVQGRARCLQQQQATRTSAGTWQRARSTAWSPSRQRTPTKKPKTSLATTP